jgi:hypothetical protein
MLQGPQTSPLNLETSVPPFSTQTDKPVKPPSRGPISERTRNASPRPRMLRSRPVRPSSEAHTERLLDRLVAEHARSFHRGDHAAH